MESDISALWWLRMNESCNSEEDVTYVCLHVRTRRSQGCPLRKNPNCVNCGSRHRNWSWAPSKKCMISSTPLLYAALSVCDYYLGSNSNNCLILYHNAILQPHFYHSHSYNSFLYYSVITCSKPNCIPLLWLTFRHLFISCHVTLRALKTHRIYREVLKLSTP